jgi:hypothetical protein
MSILSKLKGTAQDTAARSTRGSGGRGSTGGRGSGGRGSVMGKGMGGPRPGRASTGRGTATTGRFSGFRSRGTSVAGRGRTAPAPSGGLSKLLGNLTGRR